jgi:hypothetical protein
MTEREVPLDGACTADTRLGGFALTLTDQSLFTGYVATAPDPEAAETELAHVSDCFLFSHPPSCEPACEAGESCQSGTCVAAAPAMDLGAVTLEGVASPVAVSPTDGRYEQALTHPAVVGGEILSLALPDGVTLWGVGVEPFVLAQPSWELSPKADTELQWSETSHNVVRSRMLVTLSTGGTDFIRCDFADDSRATIPGALVAELPEGTPTLTMSRRTTDADTVGEGCVDLVIEQPQDVPVTLAR